jgi:hypothetical protein
MEYFIGVVLALAVAGLAAAVGFARDRSFAPTVLIVVGSLYVLFAIIGESRRALVIESVFASGFLLSAVLGFKKIPWLIPAAMVGHGVFDFFHNSLVANPGVPSWWPGFCGAYDVVFGGWLAWELARRSHRVMNKATLKKRSGFR